MFIQKQQRIAIQVMRSNGKPCESLEKHKNEVLFYEFGGATNKESIGEN